MIAVKARYEHGEIKLLEPAPPVESAPAVVVFLSSLTETIPEPGPIQSDELEDEIGAYHLMHVDLVKRYLGQYVATRNGALVDSDADFAMLHQRIRARFGRQPVLLRRVALEPEHTLTFRSPRLESNRP